MIGKAGSVSLSIPVRWLVVVWPLPIPLGVSKWTTEPMNLEEEESGTSSHFLMPSLPLLQLLWQLHIILNVIAAVVIFVAAQTYPWNVHQSWKIMKIVILQVRKRNSILIT